MKKKLQLLCGFFVFCAIIFTNKGYSQINYSFGFETEPVGWTTAGFFLYEEDLACEGATLVGANLYYSFFGGLTAAQANSPSIGISNGGEATLTFQYKLLNYGNPPTEATENAGDWGTIKIYYSTSASGPFTEIYQITPDTHIESTDCATNTITFSPPTGTPVFLRLDAVLGDEMNDFIVFFDDVQVAQAEPVACTGTLAESTTVAQKAALCNGQDASLSLGTQYTSGGLTFQWQKSTNGTDYSDIEGAIYATLNNPQIFSTWYKAIVTCTDSGDSITSTPVQVISTGLECLCEVVFLDTVEPITRVQFAGMDNVSSAVVNGSPSVEDFTNITPPQVALGSSYPIVLEGNTNDFEDEEYESFFKVYIDFNHNGNFNDPGESFEIGSITGSTGTDGDQATGTITIPLTATPGLTYMRVFKLYDLYSEDACSSDETDYYYGQVEDYFIDIQPCATPEPEVAIAQTFCSGATVASLAVEGTAIKWYALPTDGFALNPTQVLVNNKIYYVTQTIGCESARVAVTVTINTVAVDDLDDATACLEYVLPALENGAYYTEPNGGGEMLEAGSGVIENKTIYIYAEAGTDPICKAETSFTVTISNVEADELEDVEVCSEYVLPVLEHGTYYTEPGGQGDMLEAGHGITETRTIYIYAVSETNPACTADNSFVVTVNNITVSEMEDVEVCSEYELLALERGNYYTEPNGEGDMLEAGTVIDETTTLYIYAAEGDCNAEDSFIVTITKPIPPAGDHTVVANESFPLSEIELEAEGTITWYANLEDAENGDDPLPNDQMVPVGRTVYYATQTIDGCESDPYEVVVEIVLGTEGFDMTSFKYHPNPVSDVLNLSYSNTITNVTVFNLLGQQVLAKVVNQATAQLDLSQLALGTYMVKVQTENAFKMIKIVKK
ncbi:hypothetical protein D3C87_256300 [compost metagenome]